MTLQQLKYIAVIAETGTVSAASAQLFVSQPSLTNAVKSVEAEIGFSIFHRTNKGIALTAEGAEFLGYARQVLEQNDLLEQRYLVSNHTDPRFAVSSQHYSFAVKAFAEVVKRFSANSYDFTFRETQTYEIINDVNRLKSEIGVIYKSPANEEIIDKFLKKNALDFTELFVASPHVFICSGHPLSKKDTLSIEELADYPYLSFEQGNNNSFFFSEEILSTFRRNKNIHVTDRATLFNLVIGLNGYTVSTGIINEDLNGHDIIPKKLESDEYMRVGYIKRKDAPLSQYAQAYIEELTKLL